MHRIRDVHFVKSGYGQGIAQGETALSTKIESGILRTELKGSGYTLPGLEITFDEDGNVIRNSGVIASVGVYADVQHSLFTTGPKRRGFAEVEINLLSLPFNNVLAVYTPAFKIGPPGYYECILSWGCSSGRLEMEDVELEEEVKSLLGSP